MHRLCITYQRHGRARNDPKVDEFGLMVWSGLGLLMDVRVDFRSRVG